MIIVFNYQVVTYQLPARRVETQVAEWFEVQSAVSTPEVVDQACDLILVDQSILEKRILETLKISKEYISCGITENLCG